REGAPGALPRDALAGCRIFGRDLRPVALQFFGDKLGEAGQRALAHFRAGDADDRGVVRPDHDPDAHLRRAVCGADQIGADREIEAERHAAADGGRADEERAAIDFRNEIHDALPYAFAAAWIAARTCWKVRSEERRVGKEWRSRWWRV